MPQPLLLSLYRAVFTHVPFLWHGASRILHRRMGAAADRFGERLGQPSASRESGPLIWLHAESVGEVKTIVSLLPALCSHAHVLLTTNTQTGAEQVNSLGLDRVIHQFKPVDTAAATRAFLDYWQPDIAVFVESDMPPIALSQLGARHIPKALIAARPSKTRRQAPRLAAALLSEFDLVTASSQNVAVELEKLGARVRLVEDLKANQGAATDPMPWPDAQCQRPIWLAVSTHPEDHDLLFAAHDILQSRVPAALLVIAPRHPKPNQAWAPKRFAPAFFSNGSQPLNETGMFVMDAFGHLPRLHLLSHVSFIGGSLGNRGGHSPWEAARAGSFILTGPDIANNAPAYIGLEHKIVTAPDALAEAVLEAWAAPRPAPILQNTTDSQTARAVMDLQKDKG